MIGLHRGGLNGVHSVSPKLPADHLDVFTRIAKTVGGAMDWYDAFSCRHVGQYILFYGWRNTVPIGVDHQGVVLVEVGQIEVGQLIGVGEIDAFIAQGCHDRRHSFDGAVMAIVTEEEHFQTAGFLGGSAEHTEK